MAKKINRRIKFEEKIGKIKINIFEKTTDSSEQNYKPSVVQNKEKYEENKESFLLENYIDYLLNFENVSGFVGIFCEGSIPEKLKRRIGLARHNLAYLGCVDLYSNLEDENVYERIIRCIYDYIKFSLDEVVEFKELSEIYRKLNFLNVVYSDKSQDQFSLLFKENFDMFQKEFSRDILEIIGKLKNIMKTHSIFLQKFFLLINFSLKNFNYINLKFISKLKSKNIVVITYVPLNLNFETYRCEEYKDYCNTISKFYNLCEVYKF